MTVIIKITWQGLVTAKNFDEILPIGNKKVGCARQTAGLQFIRFTCLGPICNLDPQEIGRVTII